MRRTCPGLSIAAAPRFTLLGGGLLLAMTAGVLATLMLSPWLRSRALAAQPAATPDDAPAEDQDALDASRGLTPDQLVINEYMVRNRQLMRELHRAAEELQNGETINGLAMLQRILDLDQDAFLWVAQPRRLSSIRREAEQLLSSQSSSVLQTYERLYGIEAELLLKRAKASGDRETLIELVRRFPYTAAGVAGVDLLATRYLDHGRAGVAHRLWMGILNDPVRAQHARPIVLLKALAAAQAAGDASSAQNLAARIELITGGDAQRISSLARRILEEPILRETPPVLQNWLMSQGDVERNGAIRATTLYPHVAWRQTFFRGEDRHVRQALDEWQQDQIDNLRPVAVANSAIVVGETVLVRNFDSLVACDVQTGETLWEFPTHKSLRELIESTYSQFGPVLGSSSRAGSYLELQKTYAANATLGLLSSDGQRVFLVDGMDLTVRRSGPHQVVDRTGGDVEDSLEHPNGNRLVALDLKQPADAGGAPNPVWTLGGSPAGETAARGRLAGHFFLGPPLPVDGQLFAVTEFDRQLNLVAIEPATGLVRWMQGLSYVDRAVDDDPGRYYLACSPSFSEGVVVCPTQSGMLIGVDAAAGTLLWAYYYGDSAESHTFGRASRRSAPSFGHAGFPCLPVIEQGRVVYLPRHSAYLRCIDLHDGRELWTAPRNDAEYVGGIAEGTVVVVGARFCRGLSLRTGEELWSTRVGMPSGVGLLTDRAYLIPLYEGRIAVIDVQDGHEIGFTLPVNADDDDAGFLRSPAEADRAWRPGNLVACKDLILSVSPTQVTAFPQAGAKLERLASQLAHADNAPGTPTHDHSLLAAELELSLGDLHSARPRLSQLLALGDAAPQYERAETLMRELLYLELQQGKGDELTILERLGRLSRTPTTRGRYLIEMAELQLRRGDAAPAVQSALEVRRLGILEPFPMPGDVDRLISPSRWAQGLIARVRENFSDTELQHLHQEIDVAQQHTLASEQITPLEDFLAAYGAWPQAAEVRLELAKRLIRRGQIQRAELLLLQCIRPIVRGEEVGNRSVAARASQTLVELWSDNGLPHEAALKLAALHSQFAGERLEDGRTAADFVRQFPKDSLTWNAWRQLQPLNYRVHRVDIQENLWTEIDPRLEQSFGHYRRKFLTPEDGSFHLLDKGTTSAGEMAVINKHTGIVIGNLEVPARNSYPSLSKNAHIGHFFPLGSTARMHGVSLLEVSDNQPIWTNAPRKFVQQQEIMRVGPAGPSFCTYQARQHLVVLDPGDGEILWQRTDLDPTSGLISDPYAGLFGDDHVLVLFDADRSNYTVYRTATGEELRRGRLDVDIRQQRRVFGRKLFYLTTSTTDKRMQIWDPLTDRVEVDLPVDGRLYSTITPEDELVVITTQPGKNAPAGGSPHVRLHILDVETGESRLELPLAEDDLANLNYMRVFSDHARYYINFQRAVRVPPTRMYSYYASDTFLPVVHVQGDLIAVDKTTGKTLWSREVPQRSIIRTPHYQLPFLIAMSGLRDRWNGNKQSLLVEVFDAETGETLSLRENNFPDRILQMNYDPDRRVIQLSGLKTQIELNFSQALQHQLPPTDEPQ